MATLRRLGLALVTVWVAVTFNFILFRALPGDAVTDLSHVPRANPELKRALQRDFGLDKSKWEQYVTYLERLAHGDLGVSYDNQQPVATNLRRALGNTVPMVALGTFFAIALGILTGTASAWRRGTAVDHVVVSLALVLTSLPAQWLGLMMVILVAGRLPTSGMTDDFLVDPSLWGHARDVLTHMALPSATLALGLFGGYTLIVRSSTLDTLTEDYMLTARAKGLSAWRVIRSHALPNAMLPTVTLVGLTLGHVVTGALLIEIVFSWPGIGREMYQAVLNRDYPTLQGAFLIITLSIVLCNLVVDLLYPLLDPRVSE